MASDADALPFEASLGCLAAPATARLAAQLSEEPRLAPAEREAILAAARDTLTETLHRKLARLLVLELNAARVEGRLEGDTSEARWLDFIATSSKPAFWDSLEQDYPGLAERIETIAANQSGAALRFARAWAADRDRIEPLLGRPPGRLETLSFGAGDTHGGGLTVANLTCEGGQLLYKPRAMGIDAALADLVAALQTEAQAPLAMRVPAVVISAEHGWAEHIAHRYAADARELADFYRGIGGWLALMRLLSGTDIHQENLIARGGEAVVVDCETLFTPVIAPFPTGFGDAADKAERMVDGTVMATGLLPGRGQGLGFRGVDTSAAGALPSQQPVVDIPTIIGAGTDEARIGLTTVPVPPSQNHPSSAPVLADHWPQVLDGFDTLSALLRRLDAEGRLEPLLAGFQGATIRVVLRQTEVYAELMRMLWHPVSLHDPAPARARARDLLVQMAGNVATSPSDPAVIEAEIDNLAMGDVPLFSARIDEGQLRDTGGLACFAPFDLVGDALRSWREADLAVDRGFIRGALVSAYVNDGWWPDETCRWPDAAAPGDLEGRRRQQAAEVMRRAIASPIHGADNTVTWIAPTLTPTGWAVQPLDPDLYAGLSGMALLAAAYLREMRAGRADPVEELEALYPALLRSLDAAEEKQLGAAERGAIVRAQSPGAYLGLGSRIWTRLVLADWGLDGGDGLDRARRLAAAMPAAIEADEVNDLIQGRAGAIPPLLALARRTGEGAYLAIARSAGDALVAAAVPRDGGLCWIHRDWPDGMGGAAHGVTGIGWALFQLAAATGEARYRETAEGAFRFEDGLFDRTARNWRDLRQVGLPTSAAWCHGSVGIGLLRADLDPAYRDPATLESLRTAADATLRLGMGWNHCACHGDAGALELLDVAAAAGVAPEGVTPEDTLARLLTTLERDGPLCGLMRDAFVPGLLAGLGGVAWQLLRAHPESHVPSILTLGGSRF
jgi:type 2 lantibiotic biosynthesis protein LanM